MYRWFWIVYIVLLSTAATLLIRKLTLNFNWWILVLIGVLSLLAFYGYYKLFSMGQVGASYALITGSVIVLVALGARYFFKETWTVWTIVALSLIVGGILVLGFMNKKPLDTVIIE